MAQVDITAGAGASGRLDALLKGKRKLVLDYLTAVSGSAGRLVFSLVYFIALANALSLSDFGLFATASAAGVMLSRLLGFGFISALYRTATVRNRLIGAYTGGFLAMALLSLPLMAVVCYVVYRIFFAADIAFALFALFMASEILLWRPTEAIIIVNNGLGRFGRGAALTILGVAMRSLAAALFFIGADHSLTNWGWWYLGASGASLAVAVAFFHPRQRIRLEPRIYWRRLPDSLYVSAAELLFYLQMEFDKLIVLAVGGPQAAGVYAIIMRLVDLTAIPVRTFNMMLVQKLMRAPQSLRSWRKRLTIEAAIFGVSTLGIIVLGGVLHFYPTLLGRNVATAAPLVLLALAIPGLRNLVEYQSELLFARGQTLYRAIVLALLAGLKGLFLYLLLTHVAGMNVMVEWLNLAFAGLYLVSAAMTYSRLNAPVRRV